jgi:serine/threonine protein kinase
MTATATASDRPFVRSVGDEPLPGYRLIAPLGQGGFGEVWKCLAPGGLHKAIKFVYNDADREGGADSLRQEYQAFERIKGIRHPFLLSLERVELHGEELMMVMELADQNLAQCLDSHRSAGRPGIPREELLSYMVDAAEVLDVLSQQHRLQHLDIKPANLFLMGGHSKVGDYGLVFRIGGDEPDFDRGLTPRYVAPEILRGHIDGRSDQYSLALVYHELLTGQFPYSGRTSQQLLAQHTSGEPDLSPLPAGDRDAVRRALAKEPSHRFHTCLAFVREMLRNGHSGTVSQPMARTIHDTPAPPVFRETAGLAATQRLNPNTTQRIEGAAVPELPKSIDVFCPEMEFVRDLEGAGKRGKRILATDPSGRLQRVLMMRLESGLPAEIDRLYKLLSQPMPGVSQTLRRASPKNFTLFCPDDHRPLTELGTVPERGTALAIVADLAEKLDGLHARFGLPHGLLSTANIVADGDGFALTEYGVGALLLLARANPEWLDFEPTAAPELTKGMPLPSSDQFCLAVVFLELVGAWPSHVKRIGRGERGTLNPNIRWNLLSASEAAAVKRALASYPPDRFASCAEFVRALADTSGKAVVLEEVQPILPVALLQGADASEAPKAGEWIDALLNATGAPAIIPRPTGDSSLIVAQRPDCALVARFPINYSEGIVALKLETFRKENRYELEKTPEGVYLAPRPGANGSHLGVELDIRLPQGSTARIGEIEVVGRASNHRDADKLTGMVVDVMERLRRALTDKPERRRSPRYGGDWAVELYPIDDDLAVAGPLPGVCIDISAGGFRCALPQSLPGEHAYLCFSGVEGLHTTAVLVRVLRSEPHSDGSVQVSGRFLLG